MIFQQTLEFPTQSRGTTDATLPNIHDAGGPDDMASHARSILTSNSLTIPVSGGRLMLGTWQGIYLYEHRHRPHERSVVVTILG